MKNIVLLAMFSLALGTFPPSSSIAQQANCTAPEYRQFDFWLGTWDVFDYSSGSKGAMAGTNRVVALLNGCAIQENWVDTGGNKGTSYNSYFNLDKKWHQTWVDDSGYRLEIAGGFENGKMTLEGSHPGQRAGVTITNRLTWSLIDNNPNQVRQFWQQSRDGGATWMVAFDGLYVRKP
jgi:hypothetical protein